MAKLKAGLLSLGARGTIGDAVTYQRRAGIQIARTKPIPQYRRSLAQNYQRWDYEDAIFFWNSLTDAQKAEYRTLGSKMGLTAFAYVIRLYLRTLPDLLGRWRLDEASGAVAYDSSKQGNNGVIVGATPATGRIAGAYLFDGLNDQINCGDHPIFYLANQTFSVSFHAKVDKKDTMLIVQGGWGVGVWELYVNIFNGWPYFRILYPEGLLTAFLPIDITDDQWHHIACGQDLDNDVIWLSMDASTPNETDISAVTPTTHTGAVIISARLASYWSRGIIDEVRIWNRRLSADQILNHSERRYPL